MKSYYHVKHALIFGSKYLIFSLRLMTIFIVCSPNIVTYLDFSSGKG